jgi:MoaA/NifB/PqqE/SkfB family radical SAM enzyme
VSWQALKQRALARAQPLNVHLELTYRCNWRCVFCYNPRHNDVERLSLADWNVVLDDLRTLGTLTLTLTGGEPMASPDFFAIAEAARARAFAIRVFTNGTLLDDERAARLAALEPLSVEVSIHGATADVHDATTQRRGSFDAALRGVDQLAILGVNVVLKLPMTSMNEHQLDDVIALAEARELSLQVDPHLTPRDDGDLSPLNYAPSRDGVRRALALTEIPREERTRGGANCGLGRLTMAIDPEGNVYPCMQWRHRALGNVRTMRLAEVWHGSDVRREAADVSVAANDRLMDLSGAVSEFPYCPAIALQRTGDALVPDDSFVARATIAADLR